MCDYQQRNDIRSLDQLKSVAASCRSEAQTCTMNEERQAAERKAKNVPVNKSGIQNCFDMITRAKSIDGLVQTRRSAEMKKSTDDLEAILRANGDLGERKNQTLQKQKVVATQTQSTPTQSALTNSPVPMTKNKPMMERELRIANQRKQLELQKQKADLRRKQAQQKLMQLQNQINNFKAARTGGLLDDNDMIAMNDIQMISCKF